MSRGLGKIQTAILEYLSENSGSSSEEMRWAIFERLGHPALHAGDVLPTKWNTSFTRALDRLANAPKHITLEVRRLADLSEFIRHFPFKTLQFDIRVLRQELLPVLGDWVKENGTGPRYTVADNERFHLRELSVEDQEILKRRWCELEPTLIGCLPSLPIDHRNILFMLIAKGKNLFEAVSLNSGNSFVELGRECTARGLVLGETALKVRALCDQLFAPSTAGPLQLKSYIHTFANIPKYGRCTLKAETLEKLYRDRPEVLSRLPGFSAGRRGRNGFFGSDPTHGKLVHSLIDQSLFQDFVFVSLNLRSE